MSDPLDPVRFDAAAARFRSFFQELSTVFVEREDVLRQIALALLSREHVLMTGPPGTAKSQLASAVLRRIFDEATGAPSVFARQFTESTVQTDLVGPIDFKTLMETGRTQHFTDEGMLGAVHAFLDEVFDGRDMLLRAALNVLQERELKQGATTTRGRIECSLMTSNRYLSDVLDNSRPTLLAFVDRIAFNAFVPRGFADRGNLGTVLRRHVGARGGPVLRASLSIQDLDVLQAAVDDVDVPDAVCDAIGALLELLDAEMSAAVRADREFTPTRYLSTRTAVRCGRVLRAIVVHEKIAHPEVSLDIVDRHLAGLRLHLLLAGPAPEAVTALLERETDPHERRQLSIVRTEREVFERVLKKVPKIAHPAVSTHGETASEAPPPVDALEAELGRAAAAGPAEVLAVVRKVSAAASGGTKDGARARRLHGRAVATLNDVALRASLAARGGPPERVHEAAVELARLADAVDDGSEATRPIARWTRARALDLLDTCAARLSWAAFDAEGKGAAAVEARLARMEELAAQRASLLARGVEAPPEGGAPQAAEPRDRTWRAAVDRAEEDLVLLFDGAFRETITPRLTAAGATLADKLATLAPEVERLDAAETRLAALRGTEARHDAATTVKSRVLGPRVGVVVKAALTSNADADREAVVREIRDVIALLDRAGLRTSIPPAAAAAWAAAALVASERTPDAPLSTDLDGYRALRRGEQRIPSSLALADIALALEPAASAAPGPGLARIAALLSTVPEPLRRRAAESDLERIGRALGYLERWLDEALKGEADDAGRLEALVRSKFFRVLLDESALVRFSLEAELVADLFSEAAPAARELLARAAALEERSRAALLDAVRRRSDDAWAKALAGGAGGAT